MVPNLNDSFVEFGVQNMSAQKTNDVFAINEMTISVNDFLFKNPSLSLLAFNEFIDNKFDFSIATEAIFKNHMYVSVNTQYDFNHDIFSTKSEVLFPESSCSDMYKSFYLTHKDKFDRVFAEMAQNLIKAFNTELVENIHDINNGEYPLSHLNYNIYANYQIETLSDIQERTLNFKDKPGIGKIITDIENNKRYTNVSEFNKLLDKTMEAERVKSPVERFKEFKSL